jgi:hypothetical protein
MFTYTKLHMAILECKLAMCISRLVEFELLLELTAFKGICMYFLLVKNTRYFEIKNN